MTQTPPPIEPPPRDIKGMGFQDWNFYFVNDKCHFAPHYESDEYTAVELRRIADHMDAEEERRRQSIARREEKVKHG